MLPGKLFSVQYYKMDVSKIPIFGQIFSTLESEGIDYGKVLALVGLFFFIFVLGSYGVSQASVISWLFYTAPVWLPYITFHLFFQKWMQYVKGKFAWSNGRTILELTLPAEVTKSPEAMEFFFTQVYTAPSPDNLWQTYIDGKSVIPFTFEIVSRGGDIRFYITVPDKFVQIITANLYAQYSGIQITETDLDYTAEVPNNLKGWNAISFHLNKKKDDVIPILTYKDYKLDTMPKEEEKVDPITPMLEIMSTVKPGHQVWVQFICNAHRAKEFKKGELKAEPEWTVAAEEKINEIMQRDAKTKRGAIEEEGNPRITPGERDLVEAIERNSSKYAYETAIRYFYLSSDENDFDAGIIPRMNRSFAQTEAKGRNGIGIRWRTDFNYKWFSDPFGKIIPALKKAELREYKQRVLYPKSGAMKFVVYSAEELATLYHPPGTVALTPTLQRIGSTRGEAPGNLPTGILPK